MTTGIENPFISSFVRQSIKNPLKLHHVHFQGILFLNSVYVSCDRIICLLSHLGGDFRCEVFLLLLKAFACLEADK